MLFENKERKYTGPKTYTESNYQFLERSARKEAENIRAFLNKWISRVSSEEANELISRITSGNEINFNSAIFEIVLFALISNLGGKLEIHPDPENGSGKRPDSLVKLPNGEECYLEAVIATDDSAAEVSSERMKNVVFQEIEKLNTQNFFIGIEEKGNPKTQPSAKILRPQLTRWLNSLDPDIVAKEVEENGYKEIPTMLWEHDGWQIKFKAIPIKPERRGKGQRIIGHRADEPKWISDWQSLRKAILTKAGRYGDFTKPFIIAVNTASPFLDRIDEMQALFGEEEFFVDAANPGNEPQMNRAANGAWFGSKGPQYRRVSGVWVFNNINLWNIMAQQNTLYLNPWSNFPVPKELKQFNHAYVIGSEMQWVDGVHFSQLLGLPETWKD